jgi:putative SOS response-associated peptidase YedK
VCGRFAFFSPAEALQAAFGVTAIANLQPRYNIAPTQDVIVVRSAADGLQVDRLRWGLVPFWAKDPAIGNRMINARAETVAEKPSFRQALRRRRCVVPADGFFEWQKTADGKQPWYISAADSGLLAFAGLWEEWRGGDEGPLQTFTIITTVADAFMQTLHHRMPVMFDRAGVDQWLEPQAAPADIDHLLQAAAAPELRAWPVSRAVNTPMNDRPELIEATSLD